MESGKKLILVADDERASREYVAAILEQDYQVVAVNDGAKAVETARERGPALIIMDVQMPGKDGLTALYELRHDPATQRIPVIIMSGIAHTTGVRFSSSKVEEYMGERPDALMEKPIDPDLLLQAIEELLSR